MVTESVSRRDFLRRAALFSGAAVFGSELGIGGDAGQRRAGKRPNIIFLMSDQQRWDCVGKINAMVNTPALDRIADYAVFRGLFLAGEVEVNYRD